MIDLWLRNNDLCVTVETSGAIYSALTYAPAFDKMIDCMKELLKNDALMSEVSQAYLDHMAREWAQAARVARS